ncbi:MAG: hypothetical protein QM742_08825 [Aquabacterium sp.]
MAVLLDLRGQRAAARRVEVFIDHPADLAEHRPPEAHPVHGGVHRWATGVQQIAVLDEQQGLDDHGRRVFETAITAIRIAKAIHGLALEIEHIQTGTRLFGEGQEIAAIEVGAGGLIEPRLLDHLIAAALQLLRELRQGGIAQAQIERPMRGKARRIAGALVHLECHLGGIAGKVAGLQMRGLHLAGNQPATGPQHRHDDRQHAQPRTQRSLGRSPGWGGGGRVDVWRRSLGRVFRRHTGGAKAAATSR